MSNPGHSRLQVIPGGRRTWWRLPEACAFAPRCRYAQARCLEERPELVDIGQDHEHACFFPVGTPEGGEALARNVAAGETGRGLPVADDATVDVTTPGSHGGGPRWRGAGRRRCGRATTSSCPSRTCT